MPDFVNELQTQEFRNFKYAKLKAAGFTRVQAIKMRDWKLNAVIAELAKAEEKSIKQTSFGFHRKLKDTGIPKKK